MRTLVALILFAGVASAGAEPVKPAGMLIDFSVESSQPVANDLARASAFMEASDAQPGELARRVNGAIAQALATAKAYPSIKTRSGSTWTNPNYGKNGRAIESWHMRSELEFETRDIAALAELLGKLQVSLAVGQISVMPAAETRRKAEDEATHEAIAQFQDKARHIAADLGKPWRIRQMTIGSAGRQPIYPMQRASLMQTEAAAMPIEAGESTVSVSISGQIELIE